MKKRNRINEILVGLFIIFGALALIVLAFRVSGLTGYNGGDTYKLYAEFDNIGDLKIRAPVRVAGVRIGKVVAIALDEKTFRAKVTLLIDKRNNTLPGDTSASILTEGILGSNYIGLTPGYDTDILKDGDEIVNTHPAIILENLIGQLIYNVKNKK